VRNNRARNGDPLGLDEKDKRAIPEELSPRLLEGPQREGGQGYIVGIWEYYD
jgi:hypothetical protein